MEENGYVKMFKFVDTLPMFMSWEIDSFAIMSIFWGIGIIFSSGFLMSALMFTLGVFIGSMYEKIKNHKIKGFFKHILYMLGLIEPKTLPPSYMRIFKGA